MAQSGNRPPRSGQPANGRDRTTGNGKPAPGNDPDEAAERARDASRSGAPLVKSARVPPSGPGGFTGSPEVKSAGSRSSALKGGWPKFRQARRRTPAALDRHDCGVFGTVLVILVVFVMVLSE